MTEKFDRTITIAISKKMRDELDYIRHDISRSKIIQKLIQGYLDQMTAAQELKD